MKKIGILTYHASHNIGSMLQSYALQTYLENTFDYEVEFIDYSSPEQRNMYSIFPKKERKSIISKIKGVIRFIIDSLFYSILKTRFEDFENFKKNYLKLSKNSYMYSNEINELESYYDYIFIGSDQVWNTNCRDFTNVYFVDFKTKAKLVAYAPSLGGRSILTSNVNKLEIKKLIENMDALSVREVNGKKWLEELTEKKFEVVCDPTLLLQKSQWHNLLNSHENQPQYEDYIFFYGQAFSKQTFPIIETISKKLNKKIVMLDAKSWLYNFCFKRGFILEKHCSPLDYLSLIKNSSLVVTTSYHGTIFSTIFEKDFWTVTFKGTNPDDDRVPTLLKQIGLENRFIYLEEALNIDLEQKVDYSNYENSLEPLVLKSKNFISNSIREV